MEAEKFRVALLVGPYLIVARFSKMTPAVPIETLGGGGGFRKFPSAKVFEILVGTVGTTGVLEHLCCTSVLFRLSPVSSNSIIWHAYRLSGLVSANGEQSRNSMLDLVLSTYIRPMTISIIQEVMIDPGNGPQ